MDQADQSAVDAAFMPDGMAIDAAGETDEEGPVPVLDLTPLLRTSRQRDTGRRKASSDIQYAALPPEHCGVCAQARSLVEDLVKQCGADRACWEQRLASLGPPKESPLGSLSPDA